MIVGYPAIRATMIVTLRIVPRRALGSDPAFKPISPIPKMQSTKAKGIISIRI